MDERTPGLSMSTSLLTVQSKLPNENIDVTMFFLFMGTLGLGTRSLPRYGPRSDIM